MDWIWLVPLVLGGLAYAGKSLDIEAALVGITLGYMFLYLGVGYLVLILTFFILGVLATETGKKKKETLGLEEGKRHTGNVLSNSASALLFAILGSPAGVASAFSSALADTFSSEIGVLSKKPPISILTGKEVKVGENGGITSLGSLFAFIGAFIIAATALLFWGPSVAWLSFWFGVFGCTLDSILGDAFERRGLWGNNTTNFLSTLVAGLLAWVITML